MPRKRVIVITVCLVALIAASLLAWDLLQLQISPKYEKTIVRNFDNQEQETVLLAAESIDYSSITSLKRFGSNDPEAYLHPSTYIAYAWTNFIDSEVIDYFETRFESQQEKLSPIQIELNYEANVDSYSDFRIYNSPAPEGVAWHNVTVVMSSPNGSVSFNSGQMQFFYKNQSSYEMTQWEYDFNFFNCHVVEMKLSYSEIYGSTAGFFSNVHQIVVLDQDHIPVLVGLESGMAVS